MFPNRAEQRARRLLALENRMNVARESGLRIGHTRANEPSEFAQSIANQIVLVLASRVTSDASARARFDAVGPSIVISIRHRDHAARVAQHGAHINPFLNAVGKPIHLAVLALRNPTAQRITMARRRRARNAYEREAELMRFRFDLGAEFNAIHQCSSLGTHHLGLIALDSSIERLGINLSNGADHAQEKERNRREQQKGRKSHPQKGAFCAAK